MSKCKLIPRSEECIESYDCDCGTERRSCSAPVSGSIQMAIELLRDVIGCHSDPNDVFFNDCGNGDDCQWCEDAKKWIKEQNETVSRPTH